jgi:FkbM family methyltransferase
VLKKVFGVAILAAPVVTLGLITGRAHHAGLVLSHYFRGRAANCSLAESFHGETLMRQQSQNADEIRATSRIVRTDGPYSLWSTPAGDYWMPTASGDALVYDLGEQKRNIYGAQVHPGSIVLDAGANVGVFTRKALAAGAAKVIAIEPAPENLECLRRNFAPEITSGRVVLYPKGVWDKEDVLKFNIDPSNSARDSFVRPADKAEVMQIPVTTIDRLVEELRLPRVDFIKMDIEGAEPRAVAGAHHTIAKFRPHMALCTYHVVGDEINVPRLVREAVPDYKVTKTCLCAADQIVPEVTFFD